MTRQRRVMAWAWAVPLAIALWLSLTPAGPLKVRLTRSVFLDGACAILRGYRIDPRWQSELEEKRPRLEELWRSDGQPVLDKALEIGAVPLAGDQPVRLTLCNLPSSSRFTIVNMRHALRSFTPTPVPLRYKITTGAHELLHRALRDVDLSESRLLAAHAPESKRVRDHLHLLALLKAALIELGRSEQLQEVRQLDSRLPDPSYRRAWAIVDATPGTYLAYVEELKAAP